MHHPSYTLLYVDDSLASARFYADLLDCQPLDSRPGFALFALRSGMMLGLWSRSTVQPPPAAAPGGMELGMRVDSPAEVDAIHARWAASGVSILQAPTLQSFGHAFLAQDPDGHRLRVYALPQGA